MMTKQEYLLTKLAEECAELTKVCTKANTFGIDGTPPDRDEKVTNRRKLVLEFNDILAVVEMLQEEGILTRTPMIRSLVDAKKKRVNQYMEFSRKIGTLEPEVEK